MWPCGGSWTRHEGPYNEVFKELRGQSILCVLNLNNKVTQDDGRTLHESGRVIFQNQLGEWKRC